MRCKHRHSVFGRRCLGEIVVVFNTPCSTGCAPVGAYRSTVKIVARRYDGCILHPCGVAQHHHLIAIPCYAVEVELALRAAAGARHVVIAEIIRVKVGAHEGRAVPQAIVAVNAVGTYQYGVLFGLWRIASYRALCVYGIVDTVTVCEHMVARVNKIIFAIAFKHARPLGPLAVHAGVKVDIGSKRGVCRHFIAFNARMVGMIKIPLAVIVNKDATINLLFQVIGHHLERARGAVAGKHIMAITIGRSHHIESAIPVFHLGGIAINGNGVVAHHNGIRPINEVARRPA